MLQLHERRSAARWQRPRKRGLIEVSAKLSGTVRFDVKLDFGEVVSIQQPGGPCRQTRGDPVLVEVRPEDILVIGFDTPQGSQGRHQRER